MALGVGEAVEVEVAFAGDEAVAQEGGGEAGFGKAAGGGHLRELYLDGRLDAGLAEEVHGAVVQVVAAAQQDEGLGGEVFKVRRSDSRARGGVWRGCRRRSSYTARDVRGRSHPAGRRAGWCQ